MQPTPRAPGPSVPPPAQTPYPLAPGNRPVQGSAPAGSSSQYLRTPVIHYSSRMRVGKLHRLSVTLTGTGAKTPTPATSGGFEPPLVVQVSVPGALVTPAHVILPLGGGEANFYVQPLAAGKLNGAKVEFLSQGRRIGETPLRMKANRGRLAFWLFLFAIALPFLIHLLPKPVFVDTAPVAKSAHGGDLPLLGPPEPTGPPKTAPGKEGAPDKTPGKNPAKAGGKQTGLMPENYDLHLSANLDNDEPTALIVRSLMPLIVEKSSVYPVLFQEKEGPQEGSLPQRTRNRPAPNGAAPAGGPVQGAPIRYEGEDAIWAWIKSLVTSAGYPVKLESTTASGGDGVNILFDFFFYKRQYTIDGESDREWDTKRLMAVVLYYLEPPICGIYRFLFVIPTKIPFGDMIYFFGFLALAALVWAGTKPNRTKVKGALMDIRIGG